MISAVVLVKNLSVDFKNTLASLSFCDEIILINSETGENKNLKLDGRVRCYFRDLQNDFSGQRNFGLEKARHEWVLFVDSDEYISGDLEKEIKDFVHSAGDYSGMSFLRQDFFLGKKLSFGETANSSFVRLIKRGKGRWKGAVHEVLVVDGKIKTAKNRIFHYSHKNISEFLLKINFYTTIRAKELKENGRKTNFLQIVFNPAGKFLVNYFFRFGLLDGMPGLILALGMSFHSFLVRAKLFLLQK